MRSSFEILNTEWEANGKQGINGKEGIAGTSDPIQWGGSLPPFLISVEFRAFRGLTLLRLFVRPRASDLGVAEREARAQSSEDGRPLPKPHRPPSLQPVRFLHFPFRHGGEKFIEVLAAASGCFGAEIIEGEERGHLFGGGACEELIH